MSFRKGFVNLSALTLLLTLAIPVLGVEAISTPQGEPLVGNAAASHEAGAIHEDRKRGYEPPGTGELPILTFPGLSAEKARNAARNLSSLDRKEAAAMVAADNQYRALEDPDADPTPVSIEVPAGEGVMPAPPPFEHLEPGLQSFQGTNPGKPSSNSDSGSMSLAGACAGNCYQSDRLVLTDPGNDIYAGEYLVWLAIPQNNDTNKCDSTSNSVGCFWFFSTQYDVASEPYSNSAFHIGPQRGSSIAGSAGSNWRMNIDGYIDGVHIGGQSSTNLPVATWIRVRTWRLSYGYDSTAPYAPWAQWGVWGMWGGVDRYLGSLTIDGHWIKSAWMFVEVYEADGQCSTDLERGYFDNARYWRPGAAQAAFADARASYEANCDDTSWHSLGGDFVRDERETPRIIPENQLVW